MSEDRFENVTPPVPAARVQETEADLSPAERLDRALTAVKRQYGQDWNPLVRLIELAEQAASEGDLKTAMTGYQAVADRYAPKLKAVEVKHSTDVPSVIELVPVQDSKTSGSGPHRKFRVD